MSLCPSLYIYIYICFYLCVYTNRSTRTAVDNYIDDCRCASIFTYRRQRHACVGCVRVTATGIEAQEIMFKDSLKEREETRREERPSGYGERQPYAKPRSCDKRGDEEEEGC